MGWRDLRDLVRSGHWACTVGARWRCIGVVSGAHCRNAAYTAGRARARLTETVSAVVAFCAPSLYKRALAQFALNVFRRCHPTQIRSPRSLPDRESQRERERAQPIRSPLYTLYLLFLRLATLA